MENTFIMIGGKSNSGKTALVNSLISSYPEIYKRPKSYTTRKKRVDETDCEYTFVSQQEFERLLKSDKLLTVDYVYGNRYAMDCESLFSILNQDSSNAIKEIHPKNHKKIKSLIDYKTISVLIITNKENSICRYQEDEEYFSDLSYDSFDIVFFNDTTHSIEQNAEYLNLKIKTYLKTKDSFPPVRDIDTTNRNGYNRIAKSFTEKKRVTTRNFHQCSNEFFKHVSNEFISKSSDILEIGAGNGWLSSVLKTNTENYTVLDISKEMSSVKENKSCFTTSVRCMPFSNETFDIVLASLADPYFYPEAICEINRVLKKGGLFAFSLPAKEWAEAFRKNKDLIKTEFIINNDENVFVYSFTFTHEELKKIMNDVGFRKIQLYSNKGEMLNDEISSAITKAAENINISYEELYVVTVGVFEKK